MTGATPDGRQAGLPLSRGHLARAGRRPPRADGGDPLAAKMDHVRTGGTLLNMKFTPVAAGRRRGHRALAAHLVRGYFHLDGHHVQFNVVTRRHAARRRRRTRTSTAT